MRIVHEIFEGELYIDQYVSDQEFDILKDFGILSFPYFIGDQKINLGLKIGEEFDEES